MRLLSCILGRFYSYSSISRQTPLSPGYHTGVALNPAQEACALLDPETPAILLTAGAGTGKTHTLAARLAFLLGVKTRRPAIGEAKEAIASGAGDIGRLDRTDWLEAFSRGGGLGEASSAHAAAPENVLVLSFTHQVGNGFGDFCVSNAC